MLTKPWKALKLSVLYPILTLAGCAFLPAARELPHMKGSAFGGMPSGRYFFPARDSPTALVVIVPVPGSSYTPLLQARLIQVLISRGHAVLAINQPEGLFSPFMQLAHAKSVAEFDAAARRVNETFLAFNRSVDTLIDEAVRMPHFGGLPVHMIGMSAGVPSAVVVAAENPHVEKLALIYGGGEIAGIYARSKENDTTAMRRSIRKNLSTESDTWDDARIERELRSRFVPMEPNFYASRLADKKECILFFQAIDDDYIPESSYESLWRALGMPERIHIWRGHKRAFLRTMFVTWWSMDIRKKIADFFAQDGCQ